MIIWSTIRKEIICIGKGGDFTSIYHNTLLNFRFEEMETILLPLELSRINRFGFCVNTTSEYLIILGELNNQSQIFICELRVMQFYKYKFHCPPIPLAIGPIYLISVNNTTNDQLLIHGYIGSIYNEFNLNMHKSNYYLAQIIIKYICIEYIHILNGNHHWKINIDEILNNYLMC